jgi:hypothetical protein
MKRPVRTHDPGVFVLRIEAARAATHLRRTPKGRELRPAVDLDAPPLIVAEMQVQRVHLVEGEQVDVLPHLDWREEMSSHVEHRAAPRETRCVRDRSRRYAPPIRHAAKRVLGLDARGQELAERLDAVKESRRVRGDEPDGIRCDAELVSLGAESGCAAKPQDDVAPGRCAVTGTDWQPVTGGRPQDRREHLANARGVRVARRDDDGARRGEDEWCTTPGDDGNGGRHDCVCRERCERRLLPEGHRRGRRRSMARSGGAQEQDGCGVPHGSQSVVDHRGTRMLAAVVARMPKTAAVPRGQEAPVLKPRDHLDPARGDTGATARRRRGSVST